MNKVVHMDTALQDNTARIIPIERIMEMIPHR